MHVIKTSHGSCALVAYLIHLLDMLLSEVGGEGHPALRHRGSTLNRGHSLARILLIPDKLNSALVRYGVFRQSLLNRKWWTTQ